jgi:hypothetical protein
MADAWKIRDMLESVKSLAILLTDEEISDIGKVLLRALERIQREQSNTQ